MGKVTRKRYSSDFKSLVALEAIRGELTAAEIAAKHCIHVTMVNGWKKQALNGLSGIFSGRQAPAQGNSEVELARLHAKIGQLVVDRDFLVKASGR